jgi:hypothetical protein
MRSCGHWGCPEGGVGLSTSSYGTLTTFCCNTTNCNEPNGGVGRVTSCYTGSSVEDGAAMDTIRNCMTRSSHCVTLRGARFGVLKTCDMSLEYCPNGAGTYHKNGFTVTCCSTNNCNTVSVSKIGIFCVASLLGFVFYYSRI